MSLENSSENKETFTDNNGVIRIKENGQIAPGNSGNPYGRPKGSLSLIHILKEKLEKIPENSKLSFAEAIIEALVKKAIADEDMSAIREIWDRIEGRPKDSIDVTTAGAPIALVEFVKRINDGDRETESSDSVS